MTQLHPSNDTMLMTAFLFICLISCLKFDLHCVIVRKYDERNLTDWPDFNRSNFILAQITLMKCTVILQIPFYLHLRTNSFCRTKHDYKRTSHTPFTDIIYGSQTVRCNTGWDMNEGGTQNIPRFSRNIKLSCETYMLKFASEGNNPGLRREYDWIWIRLDITTNTSL